MAESAKEYVATVQKAQTVLSYIRQEKYEHALPLAEEVVRELKELTGAEKVAYLDARDLHERTTIPLIREVRWLLGLGLKESKDLVDAAKRRPTALPHKPLNMEEACEVIHDLGAKIVFE